MNEVAPTNLQVGWIGLGGQGGPMARAVAESGIATTLWARRAQSLEAYADTPATYASTALDLMAEVDVLCVCVRDDDDVREVLLGRDQPGTSADGPPLAKMKPGSVVVIHSTIHPDLAVRIESEAAEFDVRVVDAPVSGGGAAAAAGSLLVMTAGDPATIERIMPVLRAYGDPIPYLGPVGAGQRAKLINNLVLTANMGVAESAFALAKQLRVDPANLQVVLTNGSGRSFGVGAIGGDDWDLSRAAAGAGALLQKDARLLADVAESAGSKPGLVLDAADAALGSMGFPR